MIGRKREQEAFDQWMPSGRPEFVVVYGRRRVGKTHLVREYFKDRFAFRATGVANKSMRTQLRTFHQKLVEHGDGHRSAPKDWFEAFSRLKAVLSSEHVTRDVATGRIVVFLDEMPWMDTPRSNFKSALEYFWNDWGCTRDDLLLIACGSATSWLATNLLQSTEGFYGRVTGTINLQPFCLGECDELLRYNGVELTRQQVTELYLTFGGIPYYLNLVPRGASPAQAIERLCFVEGAQLAGEFDLLFRSLFKNPEGHAAIIAALAHRKGGLTDAELRQVRGIPTGASLSRMLKDLEASGFIRKNTAYGGKKNGRHYQVIDPFCNFHLRFLDNKTFDSWEAHSATPAYTAWRGNAFELACLAHIPQIKAALGIAGVETQSYPWMSKGRSPGAQIDLVIDRRDGIVDLCEAKFTDSPYALDKDGYESLARKRDIFRKETGTSKALHLVVVAASGMERNAYAHNVQAVIGPEELFAKS